MPETKRLTASERRAQRGGKKNPYSTKSASQRRAQERVTSGQGIEVADPSRPSELSAEYISEVLAHPTKVVTEEDIATEYHYVVTDVRSIFVTAGGLTLLLIILALVLPK